MEQLWSQEVVRFFDIQVRKVTCASNLAEMLTHSMGSSFPDSTRPGEN